MSERRVTIAVRPGCPPPLTMPVAVAALGGLVLHREAWGRPSWTITHEASGWSALQMIEDRDAGLRALAALNQPRVDWRRADLVMAVGPEHREATRRARRAIGQVIG